MYSLILVLPLLSALTAGFGGRWIGSAGATRLTTTAIGLTFLLSCAAFYDVTFLSQSPVLLRLAPWRVTDVTTLHWSLLFDPLTCVRLLVVTSISTCVHLYSTEYRAEDPHLPRFRAYLSLFTFFRLVLVTAESFAQRFVGWEGVGLASYLLINFWFGRLQANKAAIKARVRNRIGDRGLSLALFLLYGTCASLNYAVVFAQAPLLQAETVSLAGFTLPFLDVVGFLLTVGAVGKSAQIGLHTWLPDAREGPTPVSALIHAATRVTAGVFLLCRCSPLLEYAPNISALLTLLGGRTAFLAATTGLVQNDLKRVIAYSTCSQLGYRVVALGLSGYAVSVYHLANHAVFKALLFRGAGSVIHARADEQDRRKRGGLLRILPFTYTTRRVGSLALRGLPFLTGFYSKDVILELAYGSFTLEGRFAHTLGSLAAFCTALYSRRLLALTFLGPLTADRTRTPRGFRTAYEGAHEPHLPRALPLGLLALASLVVGYTGRDRRIGLGTDFWGNALFTHPAHAAPLLDAEWLPTSVKLAPLLRAFTGASLGTLPFVLPALTPYAQLRGPRTRALYTRFNRKWFFDAVYSTFVSAPTLHRGYTSTYQTRDRGLLELFGPHGLASELYTASRAAAQGLPLGLLHRPLLARLRGLATLLGALTLFWPTLAFLLPEAPVLALLLATLTLLFRFRE